DEQPQPRGDGEQGTRAGVAEAHEVGQDDLGGLLGIARHEPAEERLRGPRPPGERGSGADTQDQRGWSGAIARHRPRISRASNGARFLLSGGNRVRLRRQRQSPLSWKAAQRKGCDRSAARSVALARPRMKSTWAAWSARSRLIPPLRCA